MGDRLPTYLSPTAVVGQFAMQVFIPEAVARSPRLQVVPPPVLGTQLLIDLEAFPELRWLSHYLDALRDLQQEGDRLTQAIQALAAEGPVYRDCWIEPYTKTRNGKQYTYHQLRWLTGERKKSGQPKVKTKHLSHRAVGEVRGAIARGNQVEALEKEQQQVEAQIERLTSLVQGTGRRFQRVSSQKPSFQEASHYAL